MPTACAVLFLTGLLPIMLALWANRRTSLLHALVWTMIAWVSWGVAFFFDDLDTTAVTPFRYCALCLTGCAGVAVLGARRPHVFAWNFVVLGLFTVMVLPLIETRIIGTHSIDGLRIFFMTGTIAVGILNYLPTRLGPAAFLLLGIGAGEIAFLYAPTSLPGYGEVMGFDLLLTSVPWLAWICWIRGDTRRNEFDRLWLSFRDRWGLVWSQRAREQFNNAAEHARWPVKLMWRGLTQEKGTPALSPADQQAVVSTLRATLRRFLDADS